MLQKQQMVLIQNGDIEQTTLFSLSGNGIITRDEDSLVTVIQGTNILIMDASKFDKSITNIKLNQSHCTFIERIKHKFITV